jgi:hypothetical protein
LQYIRWKAIYQTHPNLFMSEGMTREVGKTERLPTFINFIAVVVSSWEWRGWLGQGGVWG